MTWVDLKKQVDKFLEGRGERGEVDLEVREDLPAERLRIRVTHDGVLVVDGR